MNKLSRTLLFCLLAISFLTQNSYASHLSGGEMTYKFLSQENGINRYEITMRVYRNCNDSSMDIFDLDAPISIFKEDGRGGYLDERPLAVALIDPAEILQQDTNICRFLPSDICMEVGTYRFEIELPVIVQDYIIVYQRCCRPNFISNMADPDRTGITISTTISSEAQQLGNSSPIFNTAPAIINCANEGFNLDFSAEDPDGDLLVYQFSSPLLGAGILGAFEPGDPTECDGFRPNPSCAPPFADLGFTPPYTSETPLPTSDVLSLNENTGLMTGTPNFIGTFVSAVKVQEYRNGILLGETLREFHFNVINCDGCDTPTSTKDQTLNQVKIFPNPSTGKLYIELAELPTDSQLKIYDLNGKLVYQETITSHVNTINLDQLPASLYMYTINQNQEIIKQGKLIVK